MRKEMPRWQKQIITGVGGLWFLPGVPLTIAYGCAALALLVEEGAVEAGYAIALLALVVLTLGAGGAAAWHGTKSLRGQPSGPMRLPPVWALASLFGLLVVIGLVVSRDNASFALFYPPVLLAAAALPPLWAVSWFTPQRAGGLTWRRGLVALAGGATLGVFIALVLEILLPALILALVLDLAAVALEGGEAVLEALAGEDIARAISGPGFIYILIQVAVIAPLAEELAKPLVTLPLVGRLTRQQAYWVGALAGAGFAALENVIYAALGLRFWAGILLVRALGGAIHPLGAGLTALGWRDILAGERYAWRNGAIRYAAAVGLHALWNGGSLLVITLAGAQFFGELPPQIDVLGLSAAGTTLATLIVLGLATLWLGRAVGARLGSPVEAQAEASRAPFVLSDRAAAIWALACLAAIVPAGIAGLQILLR